MTNTFAFLLYFPAATMLATLGVPSTSFFRFFHRRGRVTLLDGYVGCCATFASSACHRAPLHANGSGGVLLHWDCSSFAYISRCHRVSSTVMDAQHGSHDSYAGA